MFCEIAGQGHPRINIRRVTHYVRHQCTNCSYYAVFGMCESCAKAFQTYIASGFNETWCPRCDRSCSAQKVWTVYESVAE